RALRLAIGPVLVNRIEPEAKLDLAATRALLARLPARGAPSLVQPRALSAVLEFRERRGAQQAHWLEALRGSFPTELRLIPELPRPLEGFTGVNELADAIAASGAAGAAA